MGLQSLPAPEERTLPKDVRVFVHWPSLLRGGEVRAGHALAALGASRHATPRWLNASHGIEFDGKHYAPADPHHTLIKTRIIIQHGDDRTEVLYANGEEAVRRQGQCHAVPEEHKPSHRDAIDLRSYTEHELALSRPENSVPALLAKQLDVLLQAGYRN
eukprot:4231764-Prymnesium_polylepis.1